MGGHFIMRANSILDLKVGHIIKTWNTRNISRTWTLELYEQIVIDYTSKPAYKGFLIATTSGFTLGMLFTVHEHWFRQSNIVVILNP